MPSSTPALTLDDVREHVRSRCLPASTQDRVGIELEWLTVGPEPEGDVSLASLHEVAERVVPLPGDSLITFEPGGQIPLPRQRRCRVHGDGRRHRGDP
jgi:glutamate--cysteine ligase